MFNEHGETMVENDDQPSENMDERDETKENDQPSENMDERDETKENDQPSENMDEVAEMNDGNSVFEGKRTYRPVYSPYRRGEKRLRLF